MKRQVRYVDETVVGTLSGNMTTTHLNLQGYKLGRRALEDSLETLQGRRMFFFIGHDNDEPPIGKITRAEVRQLEDGEYALWAEVELWDEAALEEINESEERGLSIAFRGDIMESSD